MEYLVPPWYLVQPPIIPNPLLRRKSLPYPIYITRMDLNAHVQVFRKAIWANGEKTYANIINLFYLPFVMSYPSGEKILCERI